MKVKSIAVCQDIADSLDEGVGIGATIIDFSKAFDLVCHDRLLMNLAASGVDSRVVVRGREFLVGRTQSVIVTSGVPQGSVLGPYCF